MLLLANITAGSDIAFYRCIFGFISGRASADYNN